MYLILILLVVLIEESAAAALSWYTHELHSLTDLPIDSCAVLRKCSIFLLIDPLLAQCRISTALIASPVRTHPLRVMSFIIMLQTVCHDVSVFRVYLVHKSLLTHSFMICLSFNTVRSCAMARRVFCGLILRLIQSYCLRRLTTGRW